LAGIVMEFIEGELFQDKRRNLIVYKKFMANFIGTNHDGIY
jgi:hypothetical protein